MQLSAYMESLNQHVELYGAMKRLWSDERLVASFTPEQHRVADTFVKEMEHHGISQTAAQHCSGRAVLAKHRVHSRASYLSLVDCPSVPVRLASFVRREA